MLTEQTLLEMLGDGHFHSGSELGDKLVMSRTAVWKHIKTLQDKYGLDIQAVQGRGYRLSRPLELFNKTEIVNAMDAGSCKLLASLDIFLQLDSTNQFLMKSREPGQAVPEDGQVVLAEMQTAGRGRRGRDWVSPFASNLYLSVLWHFDTSMVNLSGLSLAVGVAVVRSLHAMGLADIELKWPNDIFWQGQKLGGILLEMRGEAGGPCAIVIGLGLNINMPDSASAGIDQSWVDLQTIRRRQQDNRAAPLSRNKVVATVLSSLLPALTEYQQHGLAPFLEDWSRFDMLRDREVTLFMHNEQRQGYARGINQQGALQLEHDGIIEAVFAGEVSLRLAAN